MGKPTLMDQKKKKKVALDPLQDPQDDGIPLRSFKLL